MKQRLHELLDILHRIFSSRYVLYLESEVKRLRDENRQILYRLSNIPIAQSTPTLAQAITAARPANPAKLPQRPSWQQANRRKEAEVINSDRDFKAKENQRVVAETQERAEQEKKEAMSAFD